MTPPKWKRVWNRRISIGQIGAGQWGREVGGAAGLDFRVKAGLRSVPRPQDDSAEDTTW